MSRCGIIPITADQDTHRRLMARSVTDAAIVLGVLGERHAGSKRCSDVDAVRSAARPRLHTFPRPQRAEGRPRRRPRAFFYDAVAVRRLSLAPRGGIDDGAAADVMRVRSPSSRAKEQRSSTRPIFRASSTGDPAQELPRLAGHVPGRTTRGEGRELLDDVNVPA